MQNNIEEYKKLLEELWDNWLDDIINDDEYSKKSTIG